MREFKGTKGNWDKIIQTGRKGDKDVFWKSIKSENNITIAEAKGCHYGIPNEECVYNALLISKSPEMLEMLKLWSNQFDGHGEFLTSELIEKTKQLIKEATEL